MKLVNTTGLGAVGALAVGDFFTVETDTQLPHFLTASVSGDGLSVAITHTEALSGTAEASDYAITLSSGTTTVTGAVIGTGADANKVTLTLATPIYAGVTVSNLSYNRSNGVADSIGDSATPINYQPTNAISYPSVTNGSTVGAPADTTAPTTTISTAQFDELNGVLSITGTNFDTILGVGDNASTDIKGWLDWSKFAWDSNGDNSNLITLALSDVESTVVSYSGGMSIQLTATKAAAIASTAGFSTNARGMESDKIDVAAGFIKDRAGNVATTDGVTNGYLSTSYVLTVKSGDVLAPTAYSSPRFAAAWNGANAVYGDFGTVSIDATNLHGFQIMLEGAAGDVTLTNLNTAGSYVDYFTATGTANIHASGTGVQNFKTHAGNDVLSSSYVDPQSGSGYSSVIFNSGSGVDTLTGGDGADYFMFKFADFGNDTLDGGAGNDSLSFTDAATLTDSQFANISNLEDIWLANVSGNTVALGAQASLALLVSSPHKVQVSGGSAQGMTLNAAEFTKDLNVSSGSGNDDITGGSGNDYFDLATGNDTVHFAATALTNGADQIRVAAVSASLTLDLHAFLGTTVLNTTLADFLVAGLDLTGSSNVGIAYNHNMTIPLIATTAQAGKVAVADNGKAVVLWSDHTTVDASTPNQAWDIYYVEDADIATDAQTWSVTLVGQVYAGTTGATATEMATITFA